MSKEILAKILDPADIQINGSRSWDIQINDNNAYSCILKDFFIGLGETYVQGWWACENISLMIEKIARAQVHSQISLSLVDQVKAAYTMITSFASFTNNQQVNNEYSQNLYTAMLGPYMQYTSGYWRSGANDLNKAQKDRLELICKKLNIQNDSTLLNLGCDWGGAMMYLYEKYSAQSFGYTLYPEQIALVKQNSNDMLINSIDTQYSIDTTLVPYGNEPFSAALISGLFENYDPKAHLKIIHQVSESLKADGICLIEAVTMPSHQEHLLDWINKYASPNKRSVLTLPRLLESIESQFIIEDVHNFGEDYAKTLLAWYDNLEQAWSSIAQSDANKYTNQLKRMWEFYLLSYAGLFKSRYLNFVQIVASKRMVQPLCRYGGGASTPIDDGQR